MAGLSLLKGSGSVFSISLRLHLVPLLVKFIMKSSHYLNISVNLFPLLILNKTSAIDPPAGCLLHLVHHLHRVWFIIFEYYYLQHFQCQIIVIILNLFVLNVKASQIISTSFLTFFSLFFFLPESGSSHSGVFPVSASALWLLVESSAGLWLITVYGGVFVKRK